MNDLRRIGVVLPCEGLSDFPTFYQGADAEELLAAWTTAWSPRLIAAAGRTPETVCSYSLPEHPTDDENDFTDTLLLTPDLAVEEEVRRWIDEGETLLGGKWLVVESFADRAGIISRVENSAFRELLETCGEFDAEMAALGFARLQVALMTGALVDSPAFDGGTFDDDAVAAARAAVAGDQAAFDEAIGRCYDRIETTRNNCYPLDAWLLDSVLVAETTLGTRLERELAEATPKSIRITKPIIDLLNASPTAAALREAVEQQRLTVIAGDVAAATNEASPWSFLPPELMADELNAASEGIERITGVPCRVFASWSCHLPVRLPQALSLREYSGMFLGGFDGDYPNYCEHTKAIVTPPNGAPLAAITRKPHDLAAPETYLQWSANLVESLQNDPIATLPLAGWAGCRHEMLDLVRRVARRSPLLGKFVTADEYFAQTAPGERDATPTHDTLGPTPTVPTIHDSPTPLPSHILQGLAAIAGVAGDAPDFDQLARFAGGTTTPGETVSPPLLLNPWNFARSFPSQDASARKVVPGCGFAVASAVAPSPSSDGVLRGNQSAVEIDPASGGVRSLLVPRVRGPLLSQRIVAGGAPRDTRGWVAMRADSVEPMTATAAGMSIVSTGDLLDRREKRIARFRQTTELDAQENELRVAIELEPVSERANKFWFASRFVVRDSDWQASRSLQWRRLACDSSLVTASDYFELQSATQRVSFAGEGPVLVRRQDGRTVDLQIADHLSEPVATKFAIGFGDHRPLHAALARRMPPWEAWRDPASISPTEGWWLHVDTPNVVVSRIEPMPSKENSVRINLIETEGRSVTSRLWLWRPIKSATLEDNHKEPLAVDDSGVLETPVPAHGWLRIVLSW